MNRAIAILIITHLSFFVKAQVFNSVYNNYNEIYTHPTNGYSQYGREAFYSIEKIQNKVLVFGSTSRPNWDSTEVSTLITEIDDNGDTIYQQEIKIDSCEISVGLVYKQFNDNFFLFGNAIYNLYDNSAEYQGLFMKMNNNNLINYQLFDYGDLTNFYSLLFFNAKLYVVGYSDIDTASSANYDIFITKFDTLGNPLDTIQFGGNDYDIPSTIKPLPNSHLLISGYTWSYGAGAQDFYLVEMDTLGNIIWQQTYGYPGQDSNSGDNLLIDKDNNFYLCGWTESNIGNFSAWLIKTDSVGNMLWEKKFDRGANFEGFVSMKFTPEGNILLAGSTHNYSLSNNPATGWLVKVDTSGNKIWERLVSKYQPQIALHDYIYDLFIDSVGFIYGAGYILGGITDGNGIYHDNDAWLFKTDSCGFTSGAQPQALLTIDSVVGSTLYISNLSEEYCTAQLFLGNGDSVKLYAYSAYTNGTNPKQVQYTFSDTGTYNLTLYTYAGDGIDTFTTQVHIADTATSIHNVIPSEAGISISLFPNPAKDYLILQTDFEIPHQVRNDDLVMGLFTPTGQLIQTFALNPNLLQQRIFLNDLANGVYFVHFTYNGQHVGTERLSVVR